MKRLLVCTLCFLSFPVWSALSYEETTTTENTFSAIQTQAEIYQSPVLEDNPSPPMQACYGKLASCIDDCGQRFPSTLYETNENLSSCTSICNKEANLCIAETKKQPAKNTNKPVSMEQACYGILSSCMEDCDRRFPSTLYEANENFTGCAQVCNNASEPCLLKAKAKPKQTEPAIGDQPEQ